MLSQSHILRLCVDLMKVSAKTAWRQRIFKLALRLALKLLPSQRAVITNLSTTITVNIQDLRLPERALNLCWRLTLQLAMTYSSCGVSDTGGNWSGWCPTCMLLWNYWSKSLVQIIGRMNKASANEKLVLLLMCKCMSSTTKVSMPVFYSLNLYYCQMWNVCVWLWLD